MAVPDTHRDAPEQPRGLGSAIRRGVVGALAAAFLCIAAMVGHTPAAFANPWDFQCYRANVGELCIVQRNDGYDVGFRNIRTSSLVDFNLVAIVVPPNTKAWYGTQGPFYTVPGQYNSYFFAVGYKSLAQGCLYSRDYRFDPFCTPPIFTV